MVIRKRRMRNASGLAAVCAASVLGTGVAQGQARSYHFDIANESLSQALRNFAHVCGQEVVFTEDIVAGQARSLRGDYTVKAALDRLLQGTDLVAERSASGVIMIRRRLRDTGADIRALIGYGRSASAAAYQINTAAVAAESPTSDTPAPSQGDTVSDGNAGTGEIQEVVVTGLRQSLISAESIKRDSLGIVDAIAPQDIGKLPDANLAESLQRITGVSIDRSGGEGAFVTVRGFGPEFNTVLINGRQIATPTDPSQASGRAFSFDTLASELVSGVEVYKSSTAHLQSGGIGSTINVKTARPFDYAGFKFSGSVDANYEENSNKAAPDASFLLSDRFDDGRFGVLVSGSYQLRRDRLNEAQSDGWIVNGGTPSSAINGGAGVALTPSNPQGNLFVPQDFDTLVTFENRQRIGGTLVLQYQANDDLTITGDALFSRFSDVTDNRSWGHWFTPTNLSNVITDANGTAIDLTQSVGQASDFHDQKLDVQNYTGVGGLNVDWKVSDRVNLNLDGSFSRAREFPNGGRENQLALLGYLGQTIRFRSDGAILPYTTGFVDPTSGPFAGVGGGGQQLYQHVMLNRGYGIQDSIGQFRADLEIKGDDPNNGLVKLMLGTYYSHDNKDTALFSNDGGTGNQTSGYNYVSPPSVPIGIFNAGSNFLPGVSGSGRMPTQWLTFDGPALFQAITQQVQTGVNGPAIPGFTFAPPRVNDTLVQERVFGGYLESVFAGSLLDRPFSAVVGVRVEDTQVTVNGLATQFVALNKLLNDQTQYGVSTSGMSTQSSSSSYTDVLPTLSFNWKLTDNFITRFAASQTMTRPTLEDLAPVLTLVTLRPGNFAASSGNANLQPFRSNNLDMSFEYYYGESSYASVGGFYKNVSNFIVLNQTTGTIKNNTGSPLIDPGTGAPAQFTITAPTNGPTATVTGVEAALQHSFWDTGLGVQLNGTYVHSNQQLNPADLNNKFALTGLSNSMNGVLFYDKNPWEARLALNWRDHFLQYLAPPPLNGAGQAVTQVRARYQLDASAFYHFNKNFEVFAEGENLTNTYLLKYAYYQNQFLYAEDSGRRFKLGARATF
jgi:iron complex outermembrane recepter protein